MGCDLSSCPPMGSVLWFQFTHPVWGATIRWFWDHLIAGVSIHAPRVGCDSGCLRLSRAGGGRFNSRTPCGVRQYFATPKSPSVNVSIHAPRVGCDFELLAYVARYFRFNSRTPCGVRPCRRGDNPLRCGVSIHAPRVGCDLQNRYIVEYYLKFQFTHPVWGAT